MSEPSAVDVRDLGARAMYELGDPTGEGIPWEQQDDSVRRVYLRRTDAVLAAIGLDHLLADVESAAFADGLARGAAQERVKVAEELAGEYDEVAERCRRAAPIATGPSETSYNESRRIAFERAAAIARTHAHPEEG